MFCEKCGYKLVGKGGKCPNCGKDNTSEVCGGFWGLVGEKAPTVSGGAYEEDDSERDTELLDSSMKPPLAGSSALPAGNRTNYNSTKENGNNMKGQQDSSSKKMFILIIAQFVLTAVLLALVVVLFVRVGKVQKDYDELEKKQRDNYAIAMDEIKKSSEKIKDIEEEKETEPETEAETEPETEAKTEPVTEAKTEPVTEAKTEPITEAVTEATSETQGRTTNDLNEVSESLFDVLEDQNESGTTNSEFTKEIYEYYSSLDEIGKEMTKPMPHYTEKHKECWKTMRQRHNQRLDVKEEDSIIPENLEEDNKKIDLAFLCERAELYNDEISKEFRNNNKLLVDYSDVLYHLFLMKYKKDLPVDIVTTYTLTINAEITNINNALNLPNDKSVYMYTSN